MGTTLGMLLANIPVVYAGRWIVDRLPLRYARWSAFALFLIMATVTAFPGFINGLNP